MLTLGTQFFLRGTSLRQLNDEYTACLKSIINTDKILAHKQEAIKDLESAYNEAKSRLSEAQKARELEKRAQNIRSELAWAYVAGKKEVLPFSLPLVCWFLIVSLRNSRASLPPSRNMNEWLPRRRPNSIKLM